MMKTWQKAAVIGVMGLLAVYAITMADGKAVGKRGAQPPRQMVLKGDKNKDNMLSMDEFMAAPKAKFNQIDANHDGQISREEMKTFRDQQRMARDAAQKKREAQARQGTAAPMAKPAAGKPAPAPAKPAEKK